MIRKYYVIQSTAHKPCYDYSDYESEESFQSVLRQFNDISYISEIKEITKEQYLATKGV